MLVRTIHRYKMNSLTYYARFLVHRPMLQTLTLARALNILSALAAWKTRRVRPRSRPFIFRLEASAVCNLKCPGCRTPTKVRVAGQTRMLGIRSFAMIFGKISRYAQRMTFYMEGEPMTNPNLFEMVKIAAQNNVFTSFCTNFTLMRKSLVEPLFASRLDLLSVALDGYTQEAYQKYRVNGDVQRVKDGLTMVLQHKRRHGYRYPIVNVYSTLFDHVVPEVDSIQSLCAELGVDRLVFRPDETGRWGAYRHDYNPELLPRSRCFWPWLSMSIDVDGAVYPCPIAFERPSKQPYGNLLTNGLEDIWNNELYVETRRYLAGQTALPSAKLPCSTCRWYGNPRASRSRAKTAI